MALINAAVLDGVRIVVRQAAETLSSTPPSGPAPTSATTTSLAPPADTSVNGSPTSPNGNNNQGNNNGNSPLLFFVALGFGVVFTNLWIIVGVKYCFRYNARNRQMRANEDGEPITLENMPRHHRRRREKKLMTMDEVNEKFPMQKYKSWVASRAHEGLSTRGGVDVPPSRAGSVKSVQGVIPDLASKERPSTEERPTTSAAKPKTEVDSAAKPETQSTTPAADPKTDNTETEPTHSDLAAAQPNDARPSESEEDDEHINAALPPEFMTSGDTCAICIDSLDDDEDVRGLTCGHAFHAVCVDPWLTSRRACCPLCKADYYTPKPRPAAPEGTAGAENTATGVITVVLPENGRRSNRQPRSQSTWMSFRSRGRSTTSGNNASAQPQRRQSAAQAGTNSDSTPRSGGIFSRFRPAAPTGPAQQSPTETPAPSQPQGQAGGFLSSMRLPFGRGQQQEQQASNATTTPVTPSQLEAGTATQAR
ncbi:hypothetical protein RB595_005598 [Gaeumannomyces hyphopodioides]